MHIKETNPQLKHKGIKKEKFQQIDIWQLPGKKINKNQEKLSQLDAVTIFYHAQLIQDSPHSYFNINS